MTDGLGFGRTERRAAEAAGYSYRVHMTDDGIDEYQPSLAVLTDAVPALSVVPVGTSLVAGPAFHPIRKPIQDLARADHWQRSGDRIVVTFGGADPAGYSEILLKAAETELSDYHVSIVLGPGVTAARRRMMTRRARQVEVVVDPASLPKLLASADLAVTLGGLTSYEAMCLGCPVAALPWMHMASVVSRLKAAGLVAELDIQAAGEGIRRLLGDEVQLSNFAERGRSTIDGLGARRVAAAIVGCAN